MAVVADAMIGLPKGHAKVEKAERSRCRDARHLTGERVACLACLKASGADVTRAMLLPVVGGDWSSPVPPGEKN